MRIKSVLSTNGTKVTVWRVSDSAVMGSITVSGTAGTWTTTTLPTPIALTAGADYIVAVYQPSGTWYSVATSITTMDDVADGDLTAVTGIYNSGDALPNTITGTNYAVNFLYELSDDAVNNNNIQNFPSLNITGNPTTNYVQFAQQTAAPTGSSAGWKLNLYPSTVGSNSVNDYGFGTETNYLWANSDSGFKWYTDSVVNMQLESTGGLYIDAGNINAGAKTSGLFFGSTSSGEFITSNRTFGTTGNGLWGLTFWTNNAIRMHVNNGGLVGIGTSGPLYNLHVKGLSSATTSTIYVQPNEFNSTGDYGQIFLGDTGHYIRGEHTTGMTFSDANAFTFSGANVTFSADVAHSGGNGSDVPHDCTWKVATAAATTSGTATCGAGKYAVSGGCLYSGGAGVYQTQGGPLAALVDGNGVSSNNGWYCSWSGSTNTYAYALCCEY